jgi:hypothetical protein
VVREDQVLGQQLLLFRKKSGQASGLRSRAASGA